MAVAYSSRLRPDSRAPGKLFFTQGNLYLQPLEFGIHPDPASRRFFFHAVASGSGFSQLIVPRRDFSTRLWRGFFRHHRLGHHGRRARPVVVTIDMRNRRNLPLRESGVGCVMAVINFRQRGGDMPFDGAISFIHGKCRRIRLHGAGAIGCRQTHRLRYIGELRGTDTPAALCGGNR